MDRKSILVLGASIALLVLWTSVLVPKIWPPTPVPVSTNAVATATNRVATVTNITPPAVLTSATNLDVVPLVPPGRRSKPRGLRARTPFTPSPRMAAA